MRRRWLKRLQGIVGVLLMLLALGCIFFWETYGRDKLLSEEVIVLKQDVTRHTVITEDMITFVKRPKETLSINKILDLKKSQIIYSKDQIVGLTAKHYIPEGLVLNQNFFDEDKLILKENEYIFSVPRQWILAMPGSMRRGDRVVFYPVIADEEKFREFFVDRMNESGQEKDGWSNEQMDQEKLEALTEPNMNEEETKAFMIKPEKEIQAMIDRFKEQLSTFSFITAYVKDGSNREVISVETKGDDMRLDGSSSISDLEIIVTDEDVRAMNDLIEKGYIYLVMYEE